MEIACRALNNWKVEHTSHITYIFHHFKRRNLWLRYNDSPTFSANLRLIADDVVKLGAHPIFVTSLSRRSYKHGMIDDILEPWAALTRQAASASSQPYIDLLQISIKYLNAIQSAAVWKLNSSSSDKTHLNNDGGVVFSRMVADLIYAKRIVSPSPFKIDPKLSQQIREGVPSI